jgi:hypothetical protein
MKAITNSMSENEAEAVLAARWRRGTLVTSPIDSLISFLLALQRIFLAICHQFQVIHGFFALSTLTGSSFDR